MQDTENEIECAMGSIEAMREKLQYYAEMEDAFGAIQKELGMGNEPMISSVNVMRILSEFYGADWCGILSVDTDLNVWTPRWCYNKELGMLTRIEVEQFDVSDGFARWTKCLTNHEIISIPDTSAIRQAYPNEYAVYQRLHAKTILAIPIRHEISGFLLLRNPTKHMEQTTMLMVANFMISSFLMDFLESESRKHLLVSPRITSDNDVFINLFGELKITTSTGVLTEQELKSPKISRILVFLLLSKKNACTPREIADALWPNEDVDACVKNMKTLIYRAQQVFQLISDYRLINSTVNGYQLNPDLRITTDTQLFASKWTTAVKTVEISEKIEILKKAVDLYHGAIFPTARSEHWLMPIAYMYEYRFIGAVSELMRCLYQIQDYIGIQQYAAKALQMIPHSVDAYYWMIVSMNKLNHIAMAKSELRMAKCNLLEEEYEELQKRLKKPICPEFSG